MTWNIDTSHSGVEFAVRHMGVFTVRGHLGPVTGTVQVDDSQKLTGVEIQIPTASINTRTPDRDAHLRSGDFFDADRHPEITFRSTAVRPAGGDRYEVTGDLTIRGTTRPATFNVDATAPVKDPWGNTRAGAAGHGAISRKEWGLVWNQVLETGSVLVADEVKFTFDVQAVAPAPVPVR